MSNLYTFFVVNEPNYLYIYIGFVILAVGFILMSAASIAVSFTTERSSASKGAGVLSIIGACLLALYVGFPIVGFVLIFVAFPLWAVVFYFPRRIPILVEAQVQSAVKPAPRSIILNCLNCGCEIPEYAIFCPHCGEARARCPVCQKDIVSGDQFLKCPHCGA